MSFIFEFTKIWLNGNWCININVKGLKIYPNTMLTWRIVPSFDVIWTLSLTMTPPNIDPSKYCTWKLQRYPSSILHPSFPRWNFVHTWWSTWQFNKVSGLVLKRGLSNDCSEFPSIGWLLTQVIVLPVSKSNSIDMGGLPIYASM